LKRLFQLACVVSLLGLAAFARAQALPTASRAAILKAGGGWSIADPNYGSRLVQGLSIYGNLDFRNRLGIEGDIHRTSLVTPANIGVDSYLLGPRYVYRHNRLWPYAKVLFGLGRLKYIDLHTAYTYKVYAFGGGLDLKLTKRINVRTIDFEYQQWPGYPATGHAPMVFTSGAAYVI
jgi:hypothetical protein